VFPACKLLEEYVIVRLRPGANIHVVKHEC
jgi:hypothetical protein